SKTEIMNGGNSRKESETNFSSSLESTNPPHRSSASDSLRGSASCFEMDDYTREMMDLKTLVTRTLEKKGVLAKIRVTLFSPLLTQTKERKKERNFLASSPDLWLIDRAELRASVFEAIEEEDRVIQNSQGLPPALLGNCNDRARRLHASPSETESSSSLDSRNPPRRSSASDSLPPQRRSVSASQASGPTSGYIKEEHSWRYDSEDGSEEVTRASAALENLQLDRKTRNLTSSWRNVRDGTSEEAGKD
ncbi:hypothetical protein DY000_02056224, partial [Brassica cretica]